jgi:hypothetical protein
MKKLFVGMLLLVMLTGCTGLNTAISNPAINAVTDTAFVLVLQNNPNYKPVVITALNSIKVFLSDKVTYDQLITEIAKQLPGKYTVVATILTAYIAADKPISETYLSMLDSYKSGIVTKIDRLILLAGV